MTDLRTAAQQALEALKMMRDEYKEYACPACDHADAAIYALKAALVEEALQRFTDVNQELEAALSETQTWVCPDSAEHRYGKPGHCEDCGKTLVQVAEPMQEGCDHCNSPLYAAVKCRVCGRDTPIIEPEIKEDNEPVAWIHTDPDRPLIRFLEWRENEPGYRGRWIKTPLYAAPPQTEERNFCPRCGKRTNDIHTCTPPAPLTDEVIADLWHQNGGFHHHFARAIER